MEPASADTGFFQSPPVLNNQFDDDTVFQRCYNLFLSPEVAAQWRDEVKTLGKDVLSDQVFSWVRDAERNKPYVSGSGRGAFGEHRGELVTGEGWRSLQNFGLSRGFVGVGYDKNLGPFARPLEFLRLHLWEGSCANVTCPSAMQDGAARLLQLHLTVPDLTNKLTTAQRMVFGDAFARLTSSTLGYAWTSGQWMTERSGGSDVSQTETVATYQPNEDVSPATQGPWSISGFKWFSSATDANMTVLLARTRPDLGLSAFVAPLRLPDHNATTLAGSPRADGTRLNGVYISRLKNKFGTQSLPTAELVLKDMRGWMIGQEGRGIQEISHVLTITRVHSAVAAMGYVGRSLGIARAFARVRQIGAGKGQRVRLDQTPLHMATLAKMTAEYSGLMRLTFWTSYILGISEHSEYDTAGLPDNLQALTPASQHALPLIRVLAQLTKAYVCKAAVPLVFSCMEAVGGVGYLWNEEQEYLNISRIFRDCCVLPIWEGTTDVLSTDFVRALKHPGSQSLDALDHIIGKMYKPNQKHDWDPINRWNALRNRISSQDQATLMPHAREILWEVGDLLVGLLLYVDARDATAQEVFARFIEAKFRGTNTRHDLLVNQSIVYGEKWEGSKL
ncbi:acyl-CoA dehydrogenase/oxidase [Stachybotrys elegans]|uniref:Acyl-CoA dehydrogenase/oxidase n=1 Tax=Stachybotrys elegans TaxID=80388 RepID=A0A8K0T307_9HYPO|nr:acyl-CoA dehydrogenase/oxidase [Stachybotrys elegans]